ncbi:MAG: type II toxin-antitoxin system RelE/ParE family toxin [Parvibaculum sp.]|nr:type II toxin-antitoxin system RelE/ParE family toxin [Parvibaculum sp.]
MRVFKTKAFARFARKEAIGDAELWDAVKRAEKGLVDADLGGGVIKQRIARDGEGKSGGFRSIVIFQREDRAFFVFCFAKKDRDNLRKDELKAFQELARHMLDMDSKQLKAALGNQTITEVKRK